jgi:hypothetical protein
MTFDTRAGPRNRAAYARGQRIRAEIRAILLEHPPLAPPLTAKAIAIRLTRRPVPSERCIRWHVAAIRMEYELAELDGRCGNSSSVSEAAS